MCPLCHFERSTGEAVRSREISGVCEKVRLAHASQCLLQKQTYNVRDFSASLVALLLASVEMTTGGSAKTKSCPRNSVVKCSNACSRNTAERPPLTPPVRKIH